MKTRFLEKLERVKRKYYEVTGDLVSENEFLKIVSCALIVVLFFTLIGAFLIARKPPFVIRVSEAGEAEAIRDLKQNNAASDAEILHFQESFVQSFRGLNSYTLGDSTAIAWNRMTARFQKRAKKDLFDSGFLSKFEKTGLYARIETKEEKLERETEDYVFTSFVGVRTILSYNDPSFKEQSLFKADLVLKKIPRSRKVPWGLLVENYHEIILNQLEDKK